MSFSTMRFTSDTGDVQVLKVTDDPEVYNQSLHMACKRCHEKKLKCNGDEDGCDRCVRRGVACDYPARHSKKKSQSSGQPSVCSSRSGSSSSKTSSSTKRKDGRIGHSSRKSSGHALSTRHDVYGNHDESYSSDTRAACGMDMLAATTASQIPGYAATATSMDGCSARSGGYTDQWTLQAATYTAAESLPSPSSYMAASDHVYGAGGDAYDEYSQQAAYEAYQNSQRPRDRHHQ